jgi:protein-tyrosine phosphatase
VIDLHSHILPGIDDGASSLEVSIEMARLWCADGVSVVACTPHILPGVYANTGPQIQNAIAPLQLAIALKGLPLTLVAGADNHMVPDFLSGLRSGHLLTLAGSRYVLVEPPHHVCPPRLEQFFFEIIVAGYVPILTHPERLSWIDNNYATIQQLARKGVWMQLTAGSLLGQFGRRPRYWAERMLDDGLTHILASDAHGSEKRRPCLAQGYDTAARRIGENEATHLVITRPQAILNDLAPKDLSEPLGMSVEVSNVFDKPSRDSTARPGGTHASHLLTAPARSGIAGRLRSVFER